MNDNKPKDIKITKDKNLAELVQEHPKVAEILMDYGLHCVGCFANQFDTLQMGAKAHKLSDSEIEEMIIRVNELIEFGE